LIGNFFSSHVNRIGFKSLQYSSILREPLSGYQHIKRVLEGSV
jgi:hypothetical protein